ncbi:integral membrane protein [Arthrobacter crystallopoietes BAB-32]|uniref:Integral membrane protein n=1 Tax=Arthrobacter crystallopoietes BAB-32 TaxID=1246476 RepID=N1VB03_9MICC|nr:PH domain-containing protein [Arthrobacter crystallopoietes]EMY35498.1 integral membrane protein [Arthrobacter crystallopoietes BAB-32]
MSWAVAAVGAGSAWASHGAAGLLQSLPLAAIAYVAWWFAWYPAVVVSEQGVTLRNPLRTIQVPWPTLITVETKYALTLVTASGRYSAWSAPAPGLFSVQRAQPDHIRGLPETTYGPGGSVRPGDLANSDSGTAAYHVRERWAALLATGAVEPGMADVVPVRSKVNLAVLAIGLSLVAAGVLAASS